MRVGRLVFWVHKIVGVVGGVFRVDTYDVCTGFV